MGWFSAVREDLSQTGVCVCKCSWAGTLRSTAGEPPPLKFRGDLTGADRSFGQDCPLQALGTPANQIYLDV